MKRSIMVMASLAVLVLVLVVGVTLTSAENSRYDFVYDIGDIVDYDNNEWEVTALLEQKADANGKIYPYYRLTRIVNEVVTHLWVWAPEVEGNPIEGPPPCAPWPC